MNEDDFRTCFRCDPPLRLWVLLVPRHEELHRLAQVDATRSEIKDLDGLWETTPGAGDDSARIARHLRAEADAALAARGEPDVDRELEVIDLEVLWRSSPGFGGRWCP